MSNPSRSLNCRLCWTCLLPALGVENIRTTVLPQILHCPGCHAQQLHIYDDRVCGGQWAHCRGCGFSGDLLELAAHVWQIDVPGALAKLEALGLFGMPLTDEEVEAHMRDHVDYRRRLHAFWEQARGKPKELATPSIRRLLDQFDLMTPSIHRMWSYQAGQFIGSANYREVEELFGPISHQRRDRANRNGTTTVRRGGGPGGRRIFKGHEWEDVLVIPFFDLPYRISGFLFVGRNGDPEAGDFVYKRANLGCSNRPVREAGVGMLPVLDQVAEGPFNDAVFVMSDLAVGLLLQTRWMRDSLRPLPIVLSYYSPQVQTLNWRSLRQSLIAAHEAPHPARMANAVISGWLEAYGPVFGGDQEREILDRVRGIAVGVGFREFLPMDRIIEVAGKAGERWQSIRDTVLFRMQEAKRPKESIPIHDSRRAPRVAESPLAL